MIYYSLLILFSIVLLILSRLSRKLEYSLFFFYLSVFIVFIFSGFRYNAGNDYPTYYGMAVGKFDYERLEVIPKTIMDIAVYMDSPSVFFLITSFIYIFCVAYFCRKLSDNKELSFLIFLLFPLSFLTSLGYVRQFISIGFFILAIAMKTDNKNKTAYFFAFISVLCHASAVFFVPIIIFNKFISKKKIPFLISFPIILLAMISSSLVINYAYLAGSYEHYINGSNTVDAGKKIGYLSIAILFYLYVFNKKINSERDVYLFNIYVIYCFLYSFLMDFGEYVVRISYFLFPVLWVLIPKTIIFKERALKIIQTLLVVLFGLVTFYSTLYLAKINPTRDFLTDYSIIFFM